MEQLKHIVVVLALLFPIHSLAQSYLGISGGIVKNVIVGSEADFQKKIYNNEMRPVKGLTFSISIKKDITHRLYLKGGAGYIRKGNYSPNNALWNLNIEYISVPLEIGIPFSLSRRLQLGIEIGPSINFQSGSETSVLANAYSSVDSKVNKTIMSAMAGGNLEFRMSSRRFIFFNYTWYHDLTPVVSYSSGNAHRKANNQGGMFTIGLLTRLGNYNPKF